MDGHFKLPGFAATHGIAHTGYRIVGHYARLRNVDRSMRNDRHFCEGVDTDRR